MNRLKVKLNFGVLVGIAILLMACTNKESYSKKESKLAEIGIGIDVSEEKHKEDEFKKILDNLTLFASKTELNDLDIKITDSNIDIDENTIVISENLELTFDDYFDIYTKKLEDRYDYGITWGLVSQVISGEHQSKVDDWTTVITSSNAHLLDFSRPIMEGLFVNAEESMVAKDAALSFCDYIDSVYGFEKLIELSKSNIDDPEKIKLKNEWLKSIGSGVEYSPAAPYVFVCNEGNDKDEYPYYIPSESYDLYLATEDIKDEDYRDFFWYYLKTSEYWEEDMRDAREVYFGSNRDVPKVNMYTCFTKSPSHSEFAGEYNDDKIYLYGSFQNAVTIFTHEYTHHLQKEDNSKSSLSMIPHVCAINEGYAEELCNYEYRRVAFNSLFDKEEIRKAGLWDEANDCINLGLMADAEAYIEASREGIPYLSVSYTKETTDGSVKPYIYLSYPEMASLVHYLKVTKGEELVRDAFLDEKKFEALLDGGYEETYKKWVAFLKEEIETDSTVYGFVLDTIK